MRAGVKRRRQLEKALNLLFKGYTGQEIANEVQLSVNSVSRLVSKEAGKYGGARAIRSTYNAETARLARYLGGTWREVGCYFGVSASTAFNRSRFTRRPANSQSIPIVVELNIRLVESVSIVGGSIPTGDYVLSYGPKDTVILAGPSGTYQTDVDNLVGCIELGHATSEGK